MRKELSKVGALINNNTFWGTLKIYKKSKSDDNMHNHIIRPFVQVGNEVDKIVMTMLEHMVQPNIPCALYRSFWFDLVEPDKGD